MRQDNIKEHTLKMQKWCLVNTTRLQLGELLRTDSETPAAERGTGTPGRPRRCRSLSRDMGTSPLVLSLSPGSSFHLRFTPSCTHECL